LEIGPTDFVLRLSRTMERIQLNEEDWECETDLGPEFQDITSLLLQDPENSSRQTTTKRSLWFWTKHTKICVGAAFALVLLLLLVVYLTYSQKQLETTMDMMMELPD